MERPWTAGSFAEDTQRLHQREIILLGDFVRALTAAHDDDGQSDLFAERRVVRCDAVGFTRLPMRALDDRPWECLRRLRAPQAEAIHCNPYFSTRVNPLEGIHYGQCSDGSISLPRLVDHATDGLARHKGSSC